MIGIELVEIADRQGNRAMGVLVAETPENFKLAYKSKVDDYPRPNWFRVETRQWSARFKAYQTLPQNQL
jgi:hypothetical protein